MSAVGTGLLDEASVEPDKHLSMHPALRANRVVGGFSFGSICESRRVVRQRLALDESSTRPKNNALSLSGELRFTGCDCLSTSVMRATTRELNSQSARSSAFDVNNSRGRESDSQPQGFNSVLVGKSKTRLELDVFCIPIDFVLVLVA